MSFILTGFCSLATLVYGGERARKWMVIEVVMVRVLNVLFRFYFPADVSWVIS